MEDRERDVLLDLHAQTLDLLKDARDTVRQCSLERAKLLEERDMLAADRAAQDELIQFLTDRLEDAHSRLDKALRARK